ncbi:excinuclease ABC subunit UvrC [Candidatus Saccharibacteria bacterium]|nr:excinuclease ABC subunit UvrC [Candidatus Saccharibacteria bacterium]
MPEKVQEKLKQLPAEPGVYFHRSKSGEIIYVGKAAVLRNRVRQYFQDARVSDAKTDALVAEIADVEWTTTETELDALFLESEMIKRYKPRYNILLRDDKSQTFIRIDMLNPYPYVCFTRSPMDDGAEYFGPYYNASTIKKALRHLRKVFPYSTHENMPARVCLQYHLGLCPGVEEQKVSSADYKHDLRRLMRYLRGERKAIIRDIEIDMKKAAAAHDFEQAAVLRNQLRDLKELTRQIVFRDREFIDISRDHALTELKLLLGLAEVPRRIEGYDISHMSGTNNVASMVVATNGLADKSEYRKFKMRIPGNNDFAHMNEVICRRFAPKHDNWPRPDLLLIDGGKGQLGAALDALEERGVKIPAVGLAKREEEIVVHKTRSGVTVSMAALEQWRETFVTADIPYMYESEDFYVIRLPKSSHTIKLLQRIRDESHRFAVSYHTTLKRKGQVKSKLDDIPGVGPATRRKLIQSFGSGRGVEQASESQLVAVMGDARGRTIYQWLHGKPDEGVAEAQPDERRPE